MMERINSIDFANLYEETIALFLDPTSNLQAALFLYSAIALLLLIIVFTVIIFLLGADEDEDEELEGAAVGGAGTSAAARRPKEPLSPAAYWTRVAIGSALALAVWLAAGYSSGDNAVCSSCHLETPHSAASEGTDPHDAEDCVACHGSPTLVARYTAAVLPRVAHIVRSAARLDAKGYGEVGGASCSTCHARQIAGVTENTDRGLRMSHAEPAAASATCMDCHRPLGGIIGGHNAGMTPCLRCHDSKIASSECETCHTKNTAAAAAGSPTTMARALITDVKCGGCHNEERDCDSCHGMRMPHSVKFRLGGKHARAAAVDFWYNNGQGCRKCHTASRRPCNKCHGNILGNGHPTSNAIAHQSAVESACNTCHQQWAPPGQRDFCADVCHDADSMAESPR